MKHTGYGEAVRILAEDVYGMAEITVDGLAAAQAENDRLRSPGQRLALLRDRAGLDHVQIDNFVWACKPDVSGPDFFLYDLSWVGFCNGEVPVQNIAEETGITVDSLGSLREAMAAIFAKHGPHAIAVKAQHAYSRTLRWEERSDEKRQGPWMSCCVIPITHLRKRRCAWVTGAGREAWNYPSNIICRSRSTPVTTRATAGCRWTASRVETFAVYWLAILMPGSC